LYCIIRHGVLPRNVALLEEEHTTASDLCLPLFYAVENNIYAQADIPMILKSKQTFMLVYIADIE